LFWNNPEAFDGAVALASNGPTEQGIRLDLAALPAWATRVTVAAAIDGQTTFGEIGAIEVAASPGEQGASRVQATLDAATSERTLSLVEVYRRGDVWRLRAVGQGWDSDLATLAREFGMDVEE
jgi:DNA polymerase-3 subunit epsilon